jgi:hypothetical protein
MPEPDDAAVVKRAKELSEQDGFAWELTYKPVIPGAPITSQRYLSEGRRDEYLARARDELRQEGPPNA